jgi:hypothetical protein
LLVGGRQTFRYVGVDLQTYEPEIEVVKEGKIDYSK